MVVTRRSALAWSERAWIVLAAGHCGAKRGAREVGCGAWSEPAGPGLADGCPWPRTVVRNGPAGCAACVILCGVTEAAEPAAASPAGSGLTSVASIELRRI